jgi:hypothetical protein
MLPARHFFGWPTYFCRAATFCCAPNILITSDFPQIRNPIHETCRKTSIISGENKALFIAQDVAALRKVDFYDAASLIILEDQVKFLLLFSCSPSIVATRLYLSLMGLTYLGIVSVSICDGGMGPEWAAYMDCYD